MRFELSFLRHKPFLIISAATILVNLVAWIFVLFFLEKGKFNIILHYNVLFGVDFKGKPEQAFIIPLISLVIFFLNAIIIEFVYKKEKFIAYLLLSTSLVCQIFAVIAIFTIILINSSGAYQF
ncbi:MAG: hypothetical protein Q8N37_04240 [bacterium]|nr:hypothetical protein [bacterium]